MATATRTSGVAIATSLRTTYTTPLLAEIQVGSLVKASHMTAIGNFINEMQMHAHSFVDYVKIDEYGNTGSTSSVNRNFSPAPAASTAITPPTPAVGSAITAAVTNVLVNGVNGVRSHTHTFSDENGA